MESHEVPYAIAGIVSIVALGLGVRLALLCYADLRHARRTGDAAMIAVARGNVIRWTIACAFCALIILGAAVTTLAPERLALEILGYRSLGFALLTLAVVANGYATRRQIMRARAADRAALEPLERELESR